jgi:phosphatidate cytidylyltransferase
VRTDPKLPLRVVSAILFLPLLVLLARLGGPWWAALITLQVILAIGEFYRMMMVRGMRPSGRLGVAMAVVLCVLAYAGTSSSVNLLFTAGLLLIFCAELLRSEGERGIEPMAVTLFGILYVGWLSVHLILLRELPRALGQDYAVGGSYALLAFWLAWTCDTAAYGFGLAFGRHRLLPAVSPKKSVEGSLGGLVATIAAAHLARLWFAPYLTPLHATVLGFGVGVFAQVGDLAESLLKRVSGAKDASAIIPGHGGVLDRFDSLYFSAPLVYYYLRMVVFGMQ